MFIVKKETIPMILLRGFLFVLGAFVLALGTVIMIKANLGVSTWDVLHIGLSTKTSMSVGSCVIVVGLCFILLGCVLERKRPQVGTILNAVLVGLFVNWIQSVDMFFPFEIFWTRVLFLVIGIALIGFGAGMYISTGLGAGPRDGVTIALANRINWSIRMVRTILESVVLLIGWSLGGPISLGTFVSILIIGPILQYSLFFWRKQLDKWTQREIEGQVLKYHKNS